jgi:hypothetical protein
MYEEVEKRLSEEEIGLWLFTSGTWPYLYALGAPSFRGLGKTVWQYDRHLRDHDTISPNNLKRMSRRTEHSARDYHT